MSDVSTRRLGTEESKTARALPISTSRLQVGVESEAVAGEVSLTSKEGLGTTVRLVLPLEAT